MKILLIRPPARYVKGSVKPSVSLPLGLLHVASVLERRGFPVEIYDAQVNRAKPVFTDSAGVTHMGDPWETVESEIRKRKPDVVGITCPFTTQAAHAIKTGELAKRIDEGIFTVAGGNHPTVRPSDFFLKTKAFDAVCMGEGEHTMLELVEAIRDGRNATDIPGTASKDGDGFRINPGRPWIGDLDELPFPSYHLIDMESYFHLRKEGFTDRPVLDSSGSGKAVSVITSRGCPFNCVFCSIHLHMGRKWRAHSVEYVLRHLDFLISRYGIKHVHFEDDNISASVRRFQGILDGFSRMGNRFTWDTPNGVRVDTLTKEVLADCRKSGCAYLVFGVESGNQRVLDEIVDKKLNLGDVIRAAAWCREISLDAMSFFVIGFPGETRGEMQETVDFALGLQKNYDIHPGLFIATPLPGTRLEKTLMEKGLLERECTPEDLSRITQGDLALEGDTYAAADVLAVRSGFLRGCRRNVIRNIFAFLLKHPGAAPALGRAFLAARKRQPAREALLGVCLHKNFINGRRRMA